jgi:hypothetical protein
MAQKISAPVGAEPTVIAEINAQPRTLPLPPGAAAAVKHDEVVEEAIAAAAAALPTDVPFSMQQLGEVIGEAVARGISATQAPRAIKFGEYLRRQPKKPELKRMVYQNGYMLTREPLSAEEITLLNKITHSGRYIERRVEVIVEEGSGDLRINYNNKSIDQRLDNKEHWNGFVDLLRKVVAAQDLENLEADERQQNRLARR